MNFIPCVAWVSRGKAASNPDRLQLPPEELKRLVDETKNLSNQNSNETDEDENSEFENDQDHEEEIDDDNENHDDEGEEDDDFNARYNMDSYDNNDEENPLFRINDLAVHVDNHDDDYLTEEESEGDLEEKENYEIKDSDNLLIVGHVDEHSSVLEIYVYNQEEDSFYIHHDIVLSSYPLSLAWLDFHPADEIPGNYIAIGDMSSVIKIYDLDVVDVLEPDYTLGKVIKESSKKKAKKYHTDAVLSLSWNKNVRNLFASGSADSSVVVWDLTEGTVLNKLSFHSNKVQALEWHPTENQFLLSGCTDGFLKLYDYQTEDECKTWKVEGEIEKVVWDLSDSFRFFSSTDQGFVHTFDIRKEEIQRSFHAHKEGVTGLDISPLRPDMLLTASMDRTLKIWDLANDIKMIKSLKLKVGSIYTAKVAPDLKLTVAVGGNKKDNNLKVIDILKDDKDTEGNEIDNESGHTEVETKKQLKTERNFNVQTYDRFEENGLQIKNPKKEQTDFDSQTHSKVEENDFKMKSPEKKQKHFEAQTYGKVEKNELQMKSPKKKQKDFDVQTCSKFEENQLQMKNPKEREYFDSEVQHNTDENEVKVKKPKKKRKYQDAEESNFESPSSIKIADKHKTKSFK